jgi:hypothetical protein
MELKYAWKFETSQYDFTMTFKWLQADFKLTFIRLQIDYCATTKWLWLTATTQKNRIDYIVEIEYKFVDLKLSKNHSTQDSRVVPHRGTN